MILDKFLGKSSSIRVKTLSSTNLVAARYIESEKRSLDVRGFRTSVTALTLYCYGLTNPLLFSEGINLKTGNLPQVKVVLLSTRRWRQM